MQASTSKLIYAVGLFLLAMFAVTPQPRPTMLTATAISAPLSTEGRLARAISERISIEAAGELHDYRINELLAEEDGLRRLAFGDDSEGAREELIDALADELSAVMAERAGLSNFAGRKHPHLVQIEAEIRALTSAINSEVRGLST